jgi:hypothetical protein
MIVSFDEQSQQRGRKRTSDRDEKGDNDGNDGKDDADAQKLILIRHRQHPRPHLGLVLIDLSFHLPPLEELPPLPPLLLPLLLLVPKVVLRSLRDGIGGEHEDVVETVDGGHAGGEEEGEEDDLTGGNVVGALRESGDTEEGAGEGKRVRARFNSYTR